MIWNGDYFKLLMKQRVNPFLHAAGQAMINQMADSSHKVTGTLANSMTYSVGGFVSKFSTDNGAGTPPETAKLTPPTEDDIVKCGSGLVYAGPQERHNGWGSRAFDSMLSSGNLNRIAKKVFGYGL
jgi:hypothetical protein